MIGRILIAEDDDTFRNFLKTIVEDEGHEVAVAENGITARTMLSDKQFDLVVSDLKMPGKNGLDLFRETRRDPMPPRFIFLTAFGKVEEAVAAIKEGATDFLTKPLKDPDSLIRLIQQTLESDLRSREYISLKETENAGLPPEELIFAGSLMKQALIQIRNVAKTPTTVLVSGESGTGKEVVARVIHQFSPRKTAPFVALNCAAIPEQLLESELFGHEKGAFTGATQTRLGKFELARGGTLFLDEIGELPMALQAKLLRVLQERVFERVGGSREIKADVRIVAATNRNLRDEVTGHRFREDLFYRLNVFPLALPPLRERTDAIPVLAEFFLQRFSRQNDKRVSRIAPAALTAMMRYPWPGNVRELQNIIERAVILADGVIEPGDLPDDIRNLDPPRSTNDGLLKEKEKEAILAALKLSGNNRRIAAGQLGISKRTLQYRLKEYEMSDVD